MIRRRMCFVKVTNLLFMKCCCTVYIAQLNCCLSNSRCIMMWNCGIKITPICAQCTLLYSSIFILANKVFEQYLQETGTTERAMFRVKNRILLLAPSCPILLMQLKGLWTSSTTIGWFRWWQDWDKGAKGSLHLISTFTANGKSLWDSAKHPIWRSNPCTK